MLNTSILHRGYLFGGLLFHFVVQGYNFGGGLILHAINVIYAIREPIQTTSPIEDNNAQHPKTPHPQICIYLGLGAVLYVYFSSVNCPLQGLIQFPKCSSQYCSFLLSVLYDLF